MAGDVHSPRLLTPERCGISSPPATLTICTPKSRQPQALKHHQNDRQRTPRRLPESTSPSSPSHCASSSLTSQVMRLRKPNLIPQLLPTLTSRPFTTSPVSHLKDHAVIDPLLEGNGLSGVTELPNGFGSMFV